MRAKLWRAVACMASAAAIGLASAATFGPPIPRGYPNGWWCGQGSGCFSMALVIDCIKCCSLNCNYSGFLQACQAGCTGSPPPGGDGTDPDGRVVDSESSQARIVEMVSKEIDAIKAGGMSQDALASSVDFVALACIDGDAHIAVCANAMSEDIPLVQSVKARMQHERQHEVPGLAG